MSDLLSRFLARIRALDRRSPFGFDVATSLGSEFLKMGLAAAAGILLARLLGPAGRGEFAAVQAWAGFFAGVARLGVEHAVVHFTGQEPRGDGRWMGSALTVALVGGLPVVAAGLWILPSALAGERAEVLAVARLYLVAFFVIQSVRLVWISSLRGRRKLKHWNGLRIFETGAWLGTLVVGLASAREGSVWYVHAYLATMAAVTVAVVVTAERHRASPLEVTRTALRKATRFSLPLAGASVPQQLQNGARLGQLVIVAMADPRAAGLFAVAAGWVRFLRPVTQALPSVIFPYVSGSGGAGEGEARIRTGIHVTVLLAVAAGVLLAAAAPVAIPVLYGSSFGAAVPAAVVLVSGGVLRSIGESAEGGLRGLGRTGAILRAELVGLVLGGGAMVPLVDRFGLMGAAWASCLGFAVTGFLMVYTVVRSTDLAPRELVPTVAEARRLLRWAWQAMGALRRDGGEGPEDGRQPGREDR